MSRLGLDFLDVTEGDEMDLDKELAAGDADPSVDPEAKLESPTEEIDAQNGLGAGVSSPTEMKRELSNSGTTPAHMERLKSATPTPGGPSEDELAGMSARERNRLKRKRKPGNSAFVTAPPPQNAGSKYNATAAAGNSAK